MALENEELEHKIFVTDKLNESANIEGDNDFNRRHRLSQRK